MKSLTALTLLALTIFSGPAAATGQSVSGPYTHDNLTVFLVHGAAGADPGAASRLLPLDEALATGQARVHETGDVNQLQVENLTSDRLLYVEAGDIVKGGKQDRVLTVDLILPPKSGPVPIDVFCVEAGRWTARGLEAVEDFASAAKAIAGKELKLAARAARSQSAVWDAVAATQEKLSEAVGAAVAAPASPSSFQLTLENDKLVETVAEYVAAMSPLPDRFPDATGYVFSINGRISGAEVYASPAMFAKRWPKLIEASATEAVAERRAAAGGGASTAGEVLAFLADAEAGTAEDRDLPAGVKLVNRESDTAVLFETYSTTAGWLHRSYIAK